MTDDLALSSLQRRMRAMHSLWTECVETMDASHVNHFERDGVLPIAFTVHHFTRLEDQVVSVLFCGREPQWVEGGWAARTGIAIDDHGKELTVAEMQDQRIGDWDAYRLYQREVFARTEAFLDSLAPERLGEVLFGGTIPPVFAKTYSARVADPAVGLTVQDGLECWIYQHGIRHLGECEHARALVGLGGLTS